ncbi:MAG: DNA repair protein RadA [Pseudomonadota bacterium]
MVKNKVIYYCQKCGSQFPKWAGQCNECGAWNTLVEEISKPDASRFSNYAGNIADITTLAQVEKIEQIRTNSGIDELDRVLGGGLVAGSVVLIGGSPGIGKSTLLLQTSCLLSQDQHVLYVTGEESLQQVALRAQRLNLPQQQLKMMAETCVEKIIAGAKKTKPQLLVIDSIQTIFTEQLSSAPGAVSQVRESAACLVNFAKQTNTSIFLIGHVTKEGAIAGPRILEHMVDTVLYFDSNHDERFRLLRTVKNRFGSVNELGIFAMTDKGLKEVNNPSAIFLSRSAPISAGSTVTVTWEGSRPLLVELQALVDDSKLSNPRRVAVGLEQNRMAMLLAVLHRHGGIATYDQDVFVNIVGGVKVCETAADLPLLLTVLSSLRDKALPDDLVVFGEVGLSGEIRPVQSGQERLKEAMKHGFKRAIIPKANQAKKMITGLDIIAVDNLRGALAAAYH